MKRGENSADRWKLLSKFKTTKKKNFTIIKMKNTFDGLISRLDTAEAKLS